MVQSVDTSAEPLQGSPPVRGEERYYLPRVALSSEHYGQEQVVELRTVALLPLPDFLGLYFSPPAEPVEGPPDSPTISTP